MYAVRAEADHNTRVQAVMGRSVVQFTRRGVLSGLLSTGEYDSSYNSRMIGSTENLGRRMDTQFLVNWQPNLGRAILAASQDGAAASALRQERLGAAIVRLTTIQTTYEGIRSLNQEQLGGATVVALQTGFAARPSDREGTSQSSAVTTAALHVWPEIPTITIVVASIMLMGMFMVGLFVAPALPSSKGGGVGEFAVAALVHPTAG
jgi:hypothetical protein